MLKNPKTAIVWVALMLILGLSSISCGPAVLNVNNSSSPGTNSGSNAANASPSAAVACTALMDRNINASLYNNIFGPDPANPPEPELASRRRHFNFHSKDCVVYFSGWLDNITTFKKLEKLALNNSSVKSIQNDELWLDMGNANLPGSGGGCSSNYKPCGDICIPDYQSCNTEQAKAAKATPTP